MDALAACAQIASSVENARLYRDCPARARMDGDLKAARQAKIGLPSHAEIRGSVAIRSRPARDISGDVYGFLNTETGTP